jgi:hypothetical protein
MNSGEFAEFALSHRVKSTKPQVQGLLTEPFPPDEASGFINGPIGNSRLSHRYHRHRRAVLNMLPGAGTGDDQGEDGGTRGSSRKSRSET